MHPKFKKSHKEYIKGPDGRPTKRTRMKHYYVGQVSTEELIEAINKGKPKHKNKFINELTRRGVKLVWKTKDEIATEQ